MTVLTATAKSLLDGALLGPTFPLRHVSRWFGRKYHSTTIRRGGKIIFRPEASDAETFIDIFRHGAYDFSWLRQYDRVMDSYRSIIAAGQTPMIVDAGANVGAASIWFSHVFPQAHICAVEPDPNNTEVLRLNAKDRPNIEVMEAAIGSESGTVSLANPSQEAWAVQTERDPAGNIAVLTIPDVLARSNRAGSLFLVKVDIEGFESDLFKTNLGWLDDVQVVIVEPHDWLYPGAGTSKNFQMAMLERNFETIISGENLIYLRV